jgi:hypothetical protein
MAFKGHVVLCDQIFVRCEIHTYNELLFEFILWKFHGTFPILIIHGFNLISTYQGRTMITQWEAYDPSFSWSKFKVWKYLQGKVD